MASDIEIGENFQTKVSSTVSTDDLILTVNEDDTVKVFSTFGMRNTSLGYQLNLTKLWKSFSFKKSFNKSLSTKSIM